MAAPEIRGLPYFQHNALMRYRLSRLSVQSITKSVGGIRSSKSDLFIRNSIKVVRWLEFSSERVVFTDLALFMPTECWKWAI